MEQITDEARLREVIAEPPATIRDKAREVIDPVTAEFLAASPFFLFATTGPDGVDVSPRGDPAGCLLVLDERTVAFADRKGNHKLDSMRNILHDPRVGMIVVVPGSNDTVRINGRARILFEPDFAERLTVKKHTPDVAIVVDVEEVFLHCAKAFLRSHLWDPATWPAKRDVPGAGKLIKGQYGVKGPARAIDAAMNTMARTTQY
ncbi:MSMEG_1061 family FMN-dependent PPOX-type flavoprotein [Pseudonocardia phyllosphaerae]|uniref:MSMEG_1061 family FMN-dependent PPOX-type flavoprotein n=1 Tax=Pseudonocardia phyllosphaerae TaxID=3390502 RepID=UPI00397C1619